MLPVLILVGLGCLAWWLTSRITGFPREFARLLENGAVKRGPLSVLTGRATASGTFEGRWVTLHFQPANEHQSGFVMVSMRTTAPDAEDALASVRSGLNTGRSELEAALSALEGIHELRVESDGGWLRATWQPTGLFIFPGRFDPARWQTVLRHMSTLTSQLEAPAAPTTEKRSEPPRHPARPVPRESYVELPAVAAPATSVPRSEVGRVDARVEWPTRPGWRRGLGGPTLVPTFTAGLMMLVGLSMFAAAAGIGLASELSRGFAVVTGGFAAILLITSIGALVLAGRPPGLLINEGDWEPGEGDEPMLLGGWLWCLLLALLALPLWMVAQLSQLTTLWQGMFRFFDENGIWEMSQAPELSGLVLLPALGVLSVPAVELATAFGIGIAALGLTVLLVVRSPAFPRTFLVSALLLAGLVGSAQWAAHAATRLTALLDSEFFSEAGAEQTRAALARYGDVTRSAADALTVVIAGWLVWIPTLFYSSRVRETFRR